FIPFLPHLALRTPGIVGKRQTPLSPRAEASMGEQAQRGANSWTAGSSKSPWWLTIRRGHVRQLVAPYPMKNPYDLSPFV
ncbi:hypothetical protein, partial [Pseudomonas aeruginosa]|uniref:hypothetical protein n=1 Tax=Pseudomonas aeruginosa TaxID=287 RepID=UPI003CF7ECC5